MELIDWRWCRSWRSSSPRQRRRRPRSALLDLKVVDPAAGSGHFLLAAARRIGKELARVRTGEPEPAPEAQRAAIRDVVRHCLYAVDRNPLAVDLCRSRSGSRATIPAAALFPRPPRQARRQPDRRVRPRCAEEGHPGRRLQAAHRRRQGPRAGALRRNQREAEGQETLGLFGSEDLAAAEAGIARARELEALEDDSPAAVHEGRRYQGSVSCTPTSGACARRATSGPRRSSPSWRCPHRRAGAATDHRSCARALRNQPGIQGVMKTALELAQEHRFFHWPLEFAEVSAGGGFDVRSAIPLGTHQAAKQGILRRPRS